MSEESLQRLSLDELYTLMVRTIEEYIILRKGNGIKKEIQIKRIEIRYIQKEIVSKEVKKWPDDKKELR